MFFGPDGDLPNTLSLSDYQYKNTKTLQTSAVYTKSFPSHIDSTDPEGHVCHLSKCKLLYSKVLISFVPDRLLPCLQFSRTEVLWSLDAGDSVHIG